jgi:hypothetical protein
MSLAWDIMPSLKFDGDNIRHMTKTWNDVQALRQLGWA